MSSSSATTSNTSSSTSTKPPTVVIVARHGERLDYVQRDAGKNWVADNNKDQQQPYNPPLSDHGIEQGAKLGKQLCEQVKRLNLSSPISAVYSSPFLRCRQTAAAAVQEINKKYRAAKNANTSDDESAAPAALPLLKVKVEQGLSESINESWYRSWSLPDSDGTWGYRMKDGSEKGGARNSTILTDASRLHPKSMQPVQPLLEEWKTDDSSSTSTLLSDNIDYNHESKTKIEQPYQLCPRLLESRVDQRNRMFQTVEELKEVGKTIVVVSHGGPVTHLYEQMSGNSWHQHGESTYCCYSIYQQQQQQQQQQHAQGVATGETNNNNNDNDISGWKAMVVNESKYLHEKLVSERHDQN